MQQSSRPINAGISVVLTVLGVLIFLSTLAAFACVAWSARVPGPGGLWKVSGRLKSVDVQRAQMPDAAVVVTIDRAGTDFVLRLVDFQRLPQRDWPLESLNPGDQIVAWYVPDEGDTGTLWQLYRGRLRVVTFEDREKIQTAKITRVVPWLAAAALAGAVLLVTGYVLRPSSAAAGPGPS